MEPTVLTQISLWIRFTIQVCLIPFVIYVVYSLDNLNRQAAVMQYQGSQITQLIQDHEQRLRILEHQRLAEKGLQ